MTIARMTVPRMTIQRRLALAGAGTLAAGALLHALPAAAQGANDTAVVQAVEAFRLAMLKADKAAFEKLCSAQLSYGHSAGKIETKAEFIAASTSGKTTWNNIEFTDRMVKVTGNNAVARFMLTGQTLSEGKTTDIKIGVLMVWTKEGNAWKLLARQAFRV